MTIPDRISALLTRDYADDVTRLHCHRLARWASRFYAGHDEPREIVEALEHMVALSERARAVEQRSKVEVLKGELDRRVT